jgi:hypothetical protein
MLHRAHFPLTHLTAVLTIGGLGLVAGSSTPARGAAYVSAFGISGTAVSFVLNEPADLLYVSINGGPVMTLDGTTKGKKTFNLTSATDTFAVTAEKSDTTGYTIPTGTTIAAVTDGLSQSSRAGGYKLISSDTNNLVKFNSPRGVTVATNPNNPQFGTAYVANSATGTAGGRQLGDGLYAMLADQSDAFGKLDTATPTTFELSTALSSASPNRISVGGDHNLYIADWSDGSGGVYRMSPTLTDPIRVLAGNAGPPTLPAGQSHGSVTSVFVEGTATGINLYTIDEDLTSAQFTPGASSTDRNSAWRYSIGTGDTLPFTGTPTKLSSALLNVGGVSNDIDRGANGNFYLAQLRFNGAEPGITVLSPTGTLLFDSLTASRALLNSATAADIFRNVGGIAISPDQKYLAAILGNSDVAVLPLNSEGIPDLAGRLVIDTGPNVVNGRDIAFDAAGNIHYVSQGQQIYRVLAPGGFSSATTSWDGSSYSFFVIVPEPATGLLLGAGALLLARPRRRKGIVR